MRVTIDFDPTTGAVTPGASLALRGQTVSGGPAAAVAPEMALSAGVCTALTPRERNSVAPPERSPSPAVDAPSALPTHFDALGLGSADSPTERALNAGAFAMPGRYRP